MEQKRRLKLNMRALVFYFMFVSLILLVISGSILDSADVDEAARHVLIALHTVAASVFAVSIGYHFYHNWKSIFKYLKKQEDRFKYVRELAVVTGTMVMLLTLTGIYIYIKYIP